ncbi:MAG: hypothetical protein DWI48_00660 [Chloroflexi bacterium]|nr:MAG: hypothetical protein DWI48_00660 [Chloroflexota bacterium]
MGEEYRYGDELDELLAKWSADRGRQEARVEASREIGSLRQEVDRLQRDVAVLQQKLGTRTRRVSIQQELRQRIVQIDLRTQRIAAVIDRDLLDEPEEGDEQE